MTTALAVLRAVPAPELGRLDAASERMADEVRRLAATVPGPPIPRFADGRIDFLAMADPDRHTDQAERAYRVAVEALAGAAGVREH